MPDWVIYVILAVLIVIAIGFIIWAIIVYSSFTSCQSSESPYCPLMYCKDPTTACGNYPWRPDPTTGAPVCSKYLLTQAAPVAEPKTSA